MQNVYIEDQTNDTLAFIKLVEIQLDKYSSKEIILNKISLYNPVFKLKLLSNGRLNLQFLLDALSDTSKIEDTSNVKYKVNKLIINKGVFSYKNELYQSKISNVIDFDNLKISKIKLNIDSVVYIKDSINFKIKDVSFIEQSGFKLNSLSCNGYFCPSGIYLNNLNIIADKSIIRANKLNLKINNLSDFNHFEEKVKWDVNFLPSKLHSDDLAYFTNVLKPLNRKIYFAGIVKGTLSSLRFRDFKIRHNLKTYIEGNYNLDGLTNSSYPYLLLKFKVLNTNYTDFENLVISEGNQIKKITIPEELSKLGNILYKGELSGFINDFVVFGNLKTSLGNIKADANVKYDTLSNKTKINGSISLNDFFLGAIVNNKNLFGKVSLETTSKIEFKENKINGIAKALIKSIDFNNYTYKNIYIDGNFTEKLFDGNIQLNDPNVSLDFIGKIDYSANMPVFNFMADVKYARLNKINFIHPDSNITVSFMLDSKLTGTNLDNIAGNIDIYQLHFKHNNISYNIPQMLFSTNSVNENKTINFSSDIFNVSFYGYFKFNELFYYLQNVVNNYLTSIKFTNIPSKFKFNPNFSFNCELKFNEKSDFIKEIIPSLFFSKNSEIKVKFSYPQNVDLTFKADSINFSGIALKNFELNIENKNNILETLLNTDKLNIKEQTKLNKLNLKIFTTNDNNELYVNWQKTDSIIGEGQISAKLNYLNNIATVFINPSKINFNGNDWHISDGNIILTDSLIKVEQFTISEQKQCLLIKGNIGKKICDTLSIYLNNINLSSINSFLGDEISFAGNTNGELLLIKVLNNPIFISNLKIDNFKINNEELGDFKLNATWDNEKNLLSYVANAHRGNIHTLKLDGTYDINGIVNANVSLNKWRLNVLEPFVNSFATDVKGIANGNITVTGKLSNPEIVGKIELVKTAFSIPFLNTRYNFTGEVEIKKDGFFIKDLPIFDEEANKAIVNGKITHKNFKNFDLDIIINTNRLLFMNTKYTDSTMYYGSIYAAGIVNMTGSPDNISIYANVQTEKGTKFNLNLESYNAVTLNNFVNIVNKNSLTKQKLETPINNSGLNLNFNIQATPDANVQLIFDSKAGDIIKSKGTGNLRLELKPNGDFFIFGNYLISQGEYLFTLQNVINKKFEVVPGSSISFNGNPLYANVDIKALYKLRTGLYELMLDSAYKNRVSVECELNLKNKLSNPNFAFNIKIPEADSKVEGVLASMSEEEINKQVIALLVLNHFVTPDNYKSGIKSVEYSSPNALGANTSEFLTNQFNHWLSQISKTVNLGVNYRPGSVLTNEELELALNTQILNDRVTISSNLGISNNSASETSTLIGDFDVEVKISKTGKLKAKGFNKTNTNILKDTSPYTQGVSIFYREDFDSWKNLMQYYWKLLFARKEEN